MENTHNTIIYAIVGVIICAQLFFFLKNLKKIMAYKNIIVGNDKLSLIELDIDDDELTTKDPNFFINNESSFEAPLSSKSQPNGEPMDEIEVDLNQDNYDEDDVDLNNSI